MSEILYRPEQCSSCEYFVEPFAALKTYIPVKGLCVGPNTRGVNVVRKVRAAENPRGVCPVLLRECKRAIRDAADLLERDSEGTLSPPLLELERESLEALLSSKRAELETMYTVKGGKRERKRKRKQQDKERLALTGLTDAQGQQVVI